MGTQGLNGQKWCALFCPSTLLCLSDFQTKVQPRQNSSVESVLEELALHFLLSCFLLGFVNDSVAKSIVALRLTLVVKASTCVPGGGHSNDLECSGRGKCATKPSEVRDTW